MIKTGQRMRSAVCDTEVMVIRAGDGAGNLECGGSPMVEAGADVAGGSPADGLDGGTTMGKRYTHPGTGVEVLCVKPGAGTLAVDGDSFELLEGKKLPSSD